MMRTFWPCAALVVLVSVAAHAQAPSPIDLVQARAAFAEARAVSDREGGRHWGRPLYGAMLLVDPVTRATVANEPDSQGVLHGDGDLYVGVLPPSVNIADTPTEWEGKRWTMLRWPLPEETFTRQV